MPTNTHINLSSLGALASWAALSYATSSLGKMEPPSKSWQVSCRLAGVIHTHIYIYILRSLSTIHSCDLIRLAYQLLGDLQGVLGTHGYTIWSFRCSAMGTRMKQNHSSSANKKNNKSSAPLSRNKREKKRQLSPTVS